MKIVLIFLTLHKTWQQEQNKQVERSNACFCCNIFFFFMLLYTYGIFPFLFFLSIGWYRGTGVFGLIGCISLSLSLAVPTSFNNNIPEVTILIAMVTRPHEKIA